MDNFSIFQVFIINGVKVLGWEKDVGSIKEGKIVDFFILIINFVENIDYIQDFEYVIKNGQVYDF